MCHQKVRDIELSITVWKTTMNDNMIIKGSSGTHHIRTANEAEFFLHLLGTLTRVEKLRQCFLFTWSGVLLIHNTGWWDLVLHGEEWSPGGGVEGQEAGNACLLVFCGSDVQRPFAQARRRSCTPTGTLVDNQSMHVSKQGRRQRQIALLHFVLFFSWRKGTANASSSW